MIRAAVAGDEAALMVLIRATGMFQESELPVLAGMLSEYFKGHLGDGHVWVVDDDDGLQGAAYYAPEEMADGVWNLYFIAVESACRRQGRGATLLRHVEQTLRARGGRLLIVETSALDWFAPARRFYRKHGYDEEARIREFYRAGEDKVVFRKLLAAPDRSA